MGAVVQHAIEAARRLLFVLPPAARHEGTLTRRVTALKFQKRTQERVNVYLDEEYAFALPALEAARLKVGQSLTDAEVAALQDTDSEQRAVDRALNFIGYRPRSRKEIERNLERAGIDEALIEKVLERLQRQGYVDDEAFARYWVENREQFRPRGGRALRQELRQKGLEDTAIVPALEGIDSVESARKAVEPALRRWSALATADPVTFRRKVSDYLVRRGFDYETVRTVVAQIQRELDSEVPPEE